MSERVSLTGLGHYNDWAWTKTAWTKEPLSACSVASATESTSIYSNLQISKQTWGWNSDLSENKDDAE